MGTDVIPDFHCYKQPKDDKTKSPAQTQSQRIFFFHLKGMIFLSPSPCIANFSSTARMKKLETHRRLPLGPYPLDCTANEPQSTGVNRSDDSSASSCQSREAALIPWGTPASQKCNLPGSWGNSFCPLFPLLMTRCSHWLALHSFSGEKFTFHRASHRPWDDGSDRTLTEFQHQICSCQWHILHLAV